MNFKIKLNKLVSHINGGLRKRSLKIKHPYSKNLEKLLKLFTVEGVILGFQVTKCSNFFLVYLKYGNSSKKIAKVSVKSKSSRLNFLTNYELKSKIYKKKTATIFVSSDKGIFTNNPSNFVKLGGGEFLVEVTH